MPNFSTNFAHHKISCKSYGTRVHNAFPKWVLKTLRFVYEIPEEVEWWQKFGDVCNRLWLQVCTRVLLNCMWFKLCGCYFVSFWLFHFTLTSEFCPEIFINFILFHFNFNFSFWALNRLPEAPGTDTSYFSWEHDTFSSLAYFTLL